MADPRPDRDADLDIVVVNWNGGALVRACLASLAAVEDEAGLHAVVVDNASADGSADDLPRLRRGPTVIRNAANRGFAAACNQGAAAGSAPAILFLNPDTRVEPGCLTAALAMLRADPGTGVVGARQIAPDGATERGCARRPTARSLLGQALLLDRLGLVSSHFMSEWDHAEDRAVDQVMGAFLMIRRDLFAALGGFDARFFVYYEDVDLCARALDRGYAARHAASARVHHLGQGTTRQAKAHRLFYFLRAGVLYAGKHHGRGAALALLAAALCAQIPLRLVQAVARRSGAEMRAVLGAARMLLAATPGLVRASLRGRT